MPMLTPRRLLARYNLPNDSGTYQLKLPRQGLLSALEFRLEWTNGSTSCKDEDVYDAIDRITVVAEGSRILFSLTGQQARLWSHVFMKHRPPYIRTEQASVAQVAHVLIPFGLFVGDQNHYLNLEMYKDVELRVEYSPTIAATSFATGTGYLTVYGHMWEMGAPGAFQGILSITEQLFFTSAASGDQLYDLPIGRPLVGVGLYVYEAGVDPHANIDDFALNINHGALVPIDGEFEVLNTMYTELLGIDPTEHGEVFKSDTDAIETRVGTLAAIACQQIETITTPGTTDPSVIILESFAGGQATLGVFTRDAAAVAADAANTTDLRIIWQAKARFGLGNFLIVPLGLGGVGQPLNTSDYGNVRCVLSQGNAGAECRLSIAELIPPGQAA